MQDAGTGIPADDLPRLFESFYRVDKARKRSCFLFTLPVHDLGLQEYGAEQPELTAILPARQDS